MRNSPVTDEQIVGLTEASSRLLLEGIRRRPTSSFMERLLHAFINCTLQHVEQQTINTLFCFLAWKAVADS
jgi:hypothetical protein